MRNLTLTIQFCDISQSFVSAIKYENTYTYFNKQNYYYKDLPEQNDLSGSCYIRELLIQNEDKVLEEFA
jgi:hypothetical protein